MSGLTQALLAGEGKITEQMKRVAEKEGRSAEFIRERVADGRVVIPANVNHTNLEPIGIGRELLTKINANIGNSSLSSCPKEEQEKLRTALKYGADTVMDLSTGGNIVKIRADLLAKCPAPVGTVPVYEMVARAGADGIGRDLMLQVIEEQARQGVDYMTIHAGLLRRYVPLAVKRKLGIVSRGGALLAGWMMKHGKENPFYEFFDDILAVCLKYDVTLSLGDGLRPGCLADASDEAQFAELDTLGELVFRCRRAGVQAMVEGPGHIPMNEIEMNMKREREVCGDAPFYILGPVVIDCAPGYDHLVASMGGMLGAYHGAAMLCYVTPKEHIGLPNNEDVRQGVVAFKIAAHAADIGLGKPGARRRDDAISDARAEFDWEKQFSCALDEERARAARAEAIRESSAEEIARKHDGKYCTMCGPDFCSVRISERLKQAMKQE